MGSRVVVVTGASSGIGRAAAIRFAAAGDSLVLVARGREGLDEVASEIATESLTLTADIRLGADVERVADEAVARFGRIDVWVDSAAVMAYGRFEDIPAEVFDRVVSTDLLGPANVARAALRQFRRQGRGTLILCGSLLGHIATPYMSAYVTAKWGARGLVRSLRQELRDAPDIHICTLVPGSVDTPIYTSAANYAGFVGRPPPPVDTADRMGAAIVSLADRPRFERSVGLTNRLFELGFVLLPPVYDTLVTPMMRRLALSRERTGPSVGNVFAPQPRTEAGPGRFGRGAVTAAGLLLVGAVAAGAAALASAARRFT